MKPYGIEYEYARGLAHSYSDSYSYETSCGRASVAVG